MTSKGMWRLRFVGLGVVVVLVSALLVLAGGRPPASPPARHRALAEKSRTAGPPAPNKRADATGTARPGASTVPTSPRPGIRLAARPTQASASTPGADLSSGCHGPASTPHAVVCMASTPDGRGYWLVGSDGGVFAFGDAAYYGGMAGRPLAGPVVGMASTPDGRGYWLVGSDGGVFAFGDAAYYGSMGGRPLQAPVVAMTVTADGNGYWLVGSDGGVFAFGDAAYYGGMAGYGLRAPMVGLARTVSGNGYWLVSADGGVFTYGAAPYLGSMGGQGLLAPVVGMAASPSGDGYWLVSADGGIFTYGRAPYLGSTWSVAAGHSILSSIRASGPPVAVFYYPWYASPAIGGVWRHWNEGGHQPPADIGSDFYPALGAYDSSDPAVVDTQMAEIAAAGIKEVVISWWGRGSFEDAQLPLVTQSAADHGLSVAIHLEPYRGRSAATVSSDIAYLRARYHVTQFFVYQAQRISAASWSGVLRHLSGVTVWATGSPSALRSGAFERWAASAGFQGVYTYDGLSFTGPQFAGVCAAAHRDGLLCSPSVSPGFRAVRATGNPVVRSRRNGATYDQMWQGALGASPDLVTITSFNEWHEGTQIEPAQAYCIPGFCYDNYNGAYGLTGVPAESAYLSRTRYWVDRSRS